MSTRCTTHFRKRGKTLAIVYRHADGYPEEAGADILRFFAEVKKQTKDYRFNDAPYLAAKYVVFLAGMFSESYDGNGWSSHRDTRPLDFISVGVCMHDPDDIAYRYIVDCDTNEVPWVTVEGADGKSLGFLTTLLNTVAPGAN